MQKDEDLNLVLRNLVFGVALSVVVDVIVVILVGLGKDFWYVSNLWNFSCLFFHWFSLDVYYSWILFSWPMSWYEATWRAHRHCKSCSSNIPIFFCLVFHRFFQGNHASEKDKKCYQLLVICVCIACLLSPVWENRIFFIYSEASPFFFNSLS